MTNSDSSNVEATQTTEEDLQEAIEIVDKITRWMRDTKHKLDCVYDSLDLHLRNHEITEGLVGETKNRVGECRVMIKCCIEELSK